MTRFLTALVMLAVAVGFVQAQVGNERETANTLKQIGLAYHNHCDTTGKAPTKAEDLAPYLDNNKKLVDTIKSGQIVFIFDVAIRDMKAGTSNTVLAYQKDTATKGGQVLMGDGSVKKMTAEEFKKATLAKKG